MRFKYLALAFVFLSAVSGKAQNDSLSLSAVIEQVIGNYPSIIKARKNIDIADANIGLAQAAYYPDINISGQYARIHPVTEFDLSALGMGIVQMSAADNYGVALNLNQLIYDFGRTAKSRNMQQNNKKIQEFTLEQTTQQISLAAAVTFYNIAFLQKALSIKNEELASLNEHLDFVKKKLAAGTATEFSVLTTQVRISNVENEKTDIATSLAAQKSQLNSFLGRPQSDDISVKAEMNSDQNVTSMDNLLQTAFTNRMDLKIAREKQQMSRQKLGLLHAQYLPSLHLFGTGGWKNGYAPDLNKFTPNYELGVGLQIPIFDQGKTKYSKRATSSEIEANDQEIELTKRLIANDIVDSQTSIEAAQKKMQQSQMQLTQAQRAYGLAQTSFKAGAITNLDLLDSYTSLADSQLAFYKSQIDYTLNLLKLQIALGERMY